VHPIRLFSTRGIRPSRARNHPGVLYGAESWHCRMPGKRAGRTVARFASKYARHRVRLHHRCPARRARACPAGAVRSVAGTLTHPRPRRRRRDRRVHCGTAPGRHQQYPELSSMPNTALAPDVIRERIRNSNATGRDSIPAGEGARAAHQPRPQAGDVLVSRPTARADLYETSCVPAAAHITDASYEDGQDRGCRLARELAVDAWFTCDHIHAVRLAHHRV
jgi:hypothetical protein